MTDFNDVLVAVIARVKADSALDDLGNRIFFANVPQATAKPFLRISQIGDSFDGFYGHSSLDSFQLQFSVFSNDLAEANRLVRAIHTSFQGVHLVLTDQQHAGTTRRDGFRVVDVGEEVVAGVPRRIYHALAVIEVRASS